MKEHQIGRSLTTVSVQFYSLEQKLKESHTGQEWTGSGATAVFSHCLGASWVKCGLSMNTNIDLKMQQHYHLHCVQQFFLNEDLSNAPLCQPLGLRLIIPPTRDSVCHL